MPPAELMERVVTVRLPTGAAPTIIIGAGPIEEISAFMRLWNGPQDKRLTVNQDSTGPTIYTLEPIDEPKDQVLHVFVRFGPMRGDAIYIWRLNPST